MNLRRIWTRIQGSLENKCFNAIGDKLRRQKCESSA